MIEVRDLRVHYGGTRAVDGVDLAVDRGGAVAILGTSGSGKTTTALAIAGLCGGRVEGDLRIDGRPVDRSQRGATVGYVFQEPALALDPVFRIGAQIAEVARRHGRALELDRRITAVGLLPEHLERFPSQLSGGQRQRAAIAIALAGDPRVLLADEPTSALDSVAREGVLALLDELRRTHGLTLLVVTHDRRVADRLGADTLWMHGGRVVPAPPPPEWPGGTRGDRGEVVLEGRGLHVDVPEGWLRRRRILHPIDLRVGLGEIVAVVGASGSGKTTLARALCGFVRHGGELRLQGKPLDTRRHIQLVHQDPATALDPRFTLAATLREAGGDPEDLLRAVAVDAPPSARPQQLSGGQKQRVALARALAAQPQVLVLDEALSALDPHTSARILALLLDLRARRGLTLLLVSHDLDVVGRIADRVLVLDEGRLVEEAPADVLLRAPASAAGRALVAAARPAGDTIAPPSL